MQLACRASTKARNISDCTAELSAQFDGHSAARQRQRSNRKEHKVFETEHDMQNEQTKLMLQALLCIRHQIGFALIWMG